MFRSISNSWQLVKASWAVLRADKELILFPIISAAVLVVVTIVMLVPSIFLAITAAAASEFAGEATGNAIGYVGLFLFYMVSYGVSIYFNTGLIGAALIRLDGGDPTLADGFRIANEHLGKILQYAVIGATVGVILRWIQERGFIGQLVSGIIGFAWNIATFLVIPVLVSKDVGPVDAIKESAGLLKKTWGEQLAANFGIGAVFFLGYLAIIFLGGFLVFGLVAVTESIMLLGVGIAVLVMALLTLGVLQGALNGIFQATLYRYAEAGVAPDNFDIGLIQGAFREKNKR